MVKGSRPEVGMPPLGWGWELWKVFEKENLSWVHFISCGWGYTTSSEPQVSCCVKWRNNRIILLKVLHRLNEIMGAKC